MDPLDYFFSPKSVAIIGASRNPRKPGHIIFRNFLEGGFKGKVFPVNREAEEILGYRCYPSLLKIKEEIDLAVIAIPAPAVPTALEECGRKRVPAVIIISGGFKEVGNNTLEQHVQVVLKKYKIRCIGVNCVGVFDPASGVDTVFLPRYKLERPAKGSISFITQSGAIGTVVMDWMAMKGYKMAKFISYGNATDIDEADLIAYLARDRYTKVICVYLEGAKEGRKLFEIGKKYARKKPIIILKGGLTAAGAQATQSHTGSLAGEARIYQAAFRQAGIIPAEDIEELFDFARVLSTQPKPKGNRIQIITDGGGFGILTVDKIEQLGLQLAQMKKETIKKLKKQVAEYVVLKNPIDLTGTATAEDYRLMIEAALTDPNVDIICVIALLQVPQLTAEIADVIAEANRIRKKPIIVISAGGRYTEVIKKTMEDNGVPTFSYPDRAVEAMKALAEWGR